MADEEHEDIESILKDAWEKVKNEKPNEYIQEGSCPIKRERILYEHLFDVLERAILACDLRDVDDACHLVDAFDVLLAIGMAKDWIDDDE